VLAQSIIRNVNRNVGVSYCVRNDSLERYVLLNLSVNGQQAEGRCDSPSFPVGLKLQLSKDTRSSTSIAIKINKKGAYFVIACSGSRGQIE
jgi:hypothetical protein